ncbi:MAG TPA: amidohydrolase family protein [Chloroflexota bacterium]|nr:amidohydrolase family protein [Chloroflexota bacterium]
MVVRISSTSMFILDAQTHPIGMMDVDGYRPAEPEVFPTPTLAPLPSPYGGPAMGPRDWYVDELIAAMDGHGISKSVVMCGGIQVTNDNLAAAVAQYPDRLIGFAGYEHYQPSSRDAATTARAVAALERGLTDLGFTGIGELTLERFGPACPEELYVELRPIMDVARRHRAPVYVHTGYDRVTFRIKRDGAEGSSWSYLPAPLKYRDPIYLDDVALEYPDVPILVGHIGGPYLRQFEAALMLAHRHRNVYLTTANAPAENIARAVAEVGADRMIWGSDWAWRSIKEPAPLVELGHATNLATVERAGLTAAQKEAILGRTLADLLNIPVP